MRWMMGLRNMLRRRGVLMSLIAVSAGAAAFGASRRKMKNTAGEKFISRFLK
ncbi:hypothetical protein [Chengkuizengella marina]|uniref:hypothetical protein n=1 Tax=Chengkuizengella marina TaxID=2507566 RepID=UPI0013713740|nr:hypothetical protein [Chengkuizengella marina]